MNLRVNLDLIFFILINTQLVFLHKLINFPPSLIFIVLYTIFNYKNVKLKKNFLIFFLISIYILFLSILSNSLKDGISFFAQIISGYVIANIYINKKYNISVFLKKILNFYTAVIIFLLIDIHYFNILNKLIGYIVDYQSSERITFLFGNPNWLSFTFFITYCLLNLKKKISLKYNLLIFILLILLKSKIIIFLGFCNLLYAIFLQKITKFSKILIVFTLIFSIYYLIKEYDVINLIIEKYRYHGSVVNRINIFEYIINFIKPYPVGFIVSNDISGYRYLSSEDSLPSIYYFFLFFGYLAPIVILLLISDFLKSINYFVIQLIIISIFYSILEITPMLVLIIIYYILYYNFYENN